MAASTDALVAEHTRFLIERARTMASAKVDNDNQGAMQDLRTARALLQAERDRLHAEHT